MILKSVADTAPLLTARYGAAPSRRGISQVWGLLGLFDSSGDIDYNKCTAATLQQMVWVVVAISSLARNSLGDLVRNL